MVIDLHTYDYCLKLFFGNSRVQQINKNNNVSTNVQYKVLGSARFYYNYMLNSTL